MKLSRRVENAVLDIVLFMCFLTLAILTCIDLMKGKPLSAILGLSVFGSSLAITTLFLNITKQHRSGK